MVVLPLTRFLARAPHQGNHFGPKSKAAFHKLFEGRLKYMPISIDFKSYIVDGEVHLAKVDI